MCILINLNINIVNKLCAICDSCSFEIDVVCGSRIVDGKSTMGVTQMCGRIVELRPLTDSMDEIKLFFSKVEELGAYIEEK